MKSKNARPERKSGKVAATGAEARLPLVPAYVWMASMPISAILGACPRFTGYFAFFLLASFGLPLAGLAFLRNIYTKGQVETFPLFKKFLGYSLILHYVSSALPRIDWSNAGLIREGGTIYRFLLSLIPLAAGLVLFLIAGRPRIHAALGLITEEELKDPALRRKRRAAKKKGFLGSVIEWVDALAYAVILVVLVNIFVFQLYVVPSESMVPTFLTGDRPFTAKIITGPRIPLTEWRLPFARLPHRGDVVTIANPRYPENHRVDPKKYLAQVVSMITFTGVNLDTLPDGSPKADPLVKRIVGLPGEKLMMVDDVLYGRTRDAVGFSRLEADRVWSRTDLWKEDNGIRARIAALPIDEKMRSTLGAWDERKTAADPAALAKANRELGASIDRRLALLGPLMASYEKRELPVARSDIATIRDEYIRDAGGSGSLNAFARRGASAEDLSASLALGHSAQLRQSLRDYAAGWSTGEGNAYRRGSAVLSLFIKGNTLARIDRDLSLIGEGSPVASFGSDPVRMSLLKDAQELFIYLNYFYDARNFPEFPEGGSFLGPQEYFAMGDNRYNSLDFRFTTAQSPRSLDPGDPVSIVYASSLAPFALERKYIEGYALFRIWPPSRVGAIR